MARVLCEQWGKLQSLFCVGCIWNHVTPRTGHHSLTVRGESAERARRQRHGLKGYETGSRPPHLFLQPSFSQTKVGNKIPDPFLVLLLQNLQAMSWETAVVSPEASPNVEAFRNMNQ